jgi:hypothetical protein
VSDQTVKVVHLVVEAIIAIVLLCAMTWIVLSPTATDEAAKAALVVVGSAVGFLFGRQTSTPRT